MVHPKLRTVAVDPTKRGFAYVVLEGDSRLLDRGVARVWSSQEKEFLARVETILERYQPCVVVAEEITADQPRRDRVRRRILGIHRLAMSMHLPFATVSRKRVREVFSKSGVTKYDIAVALVTSFPELEIRLPPKRRPWMDADERMDLFDALSFAVTALAHPESSFPVP